MVPVSRTILRGTSRRPVIFKRGTAFNAGNIADAGIVLRKLRLTIAPLTLSQIRRGLSQLFLTGARLSGSGGPLLLARVRADFGLALGILQISQLNRRATRNVRRLATRLETGKVRPVAP